MHLFLLSTSLGEKIFVFVYFCILSSDIRTLVVDMVLATDMSSHFEQLRTMKAALSVLGK